MKKNTRKTVLYISSFVTGLVWLFTFRFGYDKTLGVFASDAYAYICSVVSLITAGVAVYCYVFTKKALKKDDILSSPDGRTALGAFLSGAFILTTAFFNLKENITYLKTYSTLDTKPKIYAVLIVLSLAVAIPSAIYFFSVSLGKNQNTKAMRICVPFTAVFMVLQVFVWYFASERAINDPVRTLCEILPGICMIYMFSETKLKLADCTQNDFAFSRSLTAVSLGISVAVASDALVTFIVKLISRFGLTISSEYTEYTLSAPELTLVFATLAVSFYALNRGNGLKKVKEAATAETVETAEATEAEEIPADETEEIPTDETEKNEKITEEITEEPEPENNTPEYKE